MNSKEKVYQIVAQIPKGKVATYGQIAGGAGTGPRVVGKYLHQNTDPDNIPCHRVVHSDGSLAPDYAFGGENQQKITLLAEGVRFKKNKVDIKLSLWRQN